MAIMRLEPFEGLLEMRREVDRLFDELFTRRPGVELTPRVTEWEPAVEMYETEGVVIVKAALPNIDPKQVEITVTNEVITLKGETKLEAEQKGRNYYRQELQYGAFMRTLPLLTIGEGRRGESDVP